MCGAQIRLLGMALPQALPVQFCNIGANVLIFSEIGVKERGNNPSAGVMYRCREHRLTPGGGKMAPGKRCVLYRGSCNSIPPERRSYSSSKFLFLLGGSGDLGGICEGRGTEGQ